MICLLLLLHLLLFLLDLRRLDGKEPVQADGRACGQIGQLDNVCCQLRRDAWPKKGGDLHRNSGAAKLCSAVKQRGQEKKGPPDIAPRSFSQKRAKWCSVLSIGVIGKSALEIGHFLRRNFWMISGGPSLSFLPWFLGLPWLAIARNFLAKMGLFSAFFLVDLRFGKERKFLV